MIAAQVHRLVPAEVTAFAGSCPADTIAAGTIRDNWLDAEKVEASFAAGVAYYGYPAGQLVCVWSITPAQGPLRMQATGLRWLGDLQAVNREMLPAEPVRLVAARDREPQVRHLRPTPIAHQWRLTSTAAPAWPQGVDALEQPPDWGRPFWHSLSQQELRPGDDPARAIAEADRQLANSACRWYTLGEYAVAAAHPVGSTWWNLLGCFVDPAARGRGSQRLLVEARLADGYSRGFRRFFSVSRPENQHSARNLVAAGFELADTVFLI